MNVLVTGATGFIGSALCPALIAAGDRVRASSRRISAVDPRAPWSWVVCDLREPATLPPALEGIECAYYLVHSMGRPGADFRSEERRSARAFAGAAASAGVARIVYLGGVAPRGQASEHLASRLEVGEILRGGAVPTLELRAGMIIGPGSASWQIVRDLSLRLPFMVLPRWLESKLRPIDLRDVIRALVAARAVPLATSEWYDLPGPETLSCQEILLRIAALSGRRVPYVRVPLLTPGLSALWLKLVTRANYPLARELVMGLVEDLLPRDEGFWDVLGDRPTYSFDDAARDALATEGKASSALGALEEALVRHFGPKERERA
jgi:uncharacterized protein YbjT (DUF2867 family)